MGLSVLHVIRDAVEYVCFSSKTVNFIIVFHTAHRDKISLNVWAAQDFLLLTHGNTPCFSQHAAEKEHEYLEIYFLGFFFFPLQWTYKNILW